MRTLARSRSAVTALALCCAALVTACGGDGAASCSQLAVEYLDAVGAARQCLPSDPLACTGLALSDVVSGCPVGVAPAASAALDRLEATYLARGCPSMRSCPPTPSFACAAAGAAGSTCQADP
ncbi:MAG: hypothetical protein NDI82_12765 [Anaeromyxobacteraceae bacterium]|nr:hypothetical protein [Anaeromyxobacteraceae bacterium]